MQKTKTAMITLCGRPNVGKSSLTNALVGEKIAIVSNKPQTTRNRIYGVVTEGDTQLVLLDTPGFHKPRNRLGDYMVKVARDSIADVDLVALLVEPVPHVGIPEQELIEKIRQSSLPAVLCINKIDTVAKKDDLLAVIAAYSEAYDFDGISRSTRPSTAKRPATRASSSARTARCSKRSPPRRGRTSSASWARRSTSRPGSRSRKTGAIT